MTVLLALLVMTVAVSGLTPATVKASVRALTTTQLPFGPDTCVRGFVWREATPDDHVCVVPSVRSQAASDNAQAAARRDPAGGPFGPDTCRTGFVWRETKPSDHVCVLPSMREQARQDNGEVSRRWAAVAHPFGQFTPNPFHHPDLGLGILSPRTAALLVVGVVSARTDDGAGLVMGASGGAGQTFKFRPVGGAPVRSNAFEIVEIRTGKCLDVAQGSMVNSTPVVLWGCHGGPNQRWHFERLWNPLEQVDEFRLHPFHSNKCLDAASPGGPAPGLGAIVQQWDCLSGHNQRWRPRLGG